MNLEGVLDLLIEGITLPFGYFISPKKRIYILYLLTSAILAFWVYCKRKNKSSFLRYLLHPKVWLSKSAKTDYGLWIINGFIKVLFVAPIVGIGIYLQQLVNGWFLNHFGLFSFEISRVNIVILYTIVLWIVGDFANFLVHFLMHRIPFLWRFHKIHHSATVLNPVTQYRVHPVELIIYNVKTILVFGIITGIFYYIAGGKIGIFTFLGVNVFRFVFLALGSNLRHSHVEFKFPGWLEYVIISPFQHQIHHSNKNEHFDKNLGSHLAIWDWLFGTLIHSKSVSEIHFGLGKEDKNYDSLLKNLYMPLLRTRKDKEEH